MDRIKESIQSALQRGGSSIRNTFPNLPPILPLTGQDAQQQQQQQSSWFPTEEWNEAVTLTRQQRMYGFVGSLGLGILCIVLACLFLPTILLTARKFAFLYTIGNLLCLGSTMFLVGPVKQIKSMFSSSRALPSSLYLCTTVLTLFSALQLQNGIVVLGLIAVQIVALIWYVLSYLPFGQRAAGTIIRMAFSGFF